jgi:hypothetical protein
LRINAKLRFWASSLYRDWISVWRICVGFGNAKFGIRSRTHTKTLMCVYLYQGKQRPRTTVYPELTSTLVPKRRIDDIIQQIVYTAVGNHRKQLYKWQNNCEINDG